MRTYTAIVTREGDHWLGSIEGLPGANTYANSLDKLREYLSETIILEDDLADDAVPAIDLQFDVSDEVLCDALAVSHRRAELAAVEAEVQASTATVIRRLTGAGYSVRDTARLVGVTPGRVSQVAPKRRLVPA
ncbi:MAG: hypothetical protein FWD83_06685 [Promicromonosporaceae bacterium]|nr:hypothetical protein [Promicromonosporaceae bacterium]